MVQRSAGVIDTNASIDISSAIANITTELQATGLGDLFALMLENLGRILCHESDGAYHHGHFVWQDD